MKTDHELVARDFPRFGYFACYLLESWLASEPAKQQILVLIAYCDDFGFGRSISNWELL